MTTGAGSESRIIGKQVKSLCELVTVYGKYEPLCH